MLVLLQLNQICEPYRGYDAEFEAEDPNNPGHTNPRYCRYTDPKGPLGILIQEAFEPKVDWITLQRKIEEIGDDDKMEEFYECWGTGPEKQFSSRYEFC